MTSDGHTNAIDRTAEAYEQIRDELTETIDIVVLVQGDEPLLNPADLDAICQRMQTDPSIGIANIMAPFTSIEDFSDENNPKVVTDANLKALYMSRAPIPSDWHGWNDNQSHMQTGLFGFRPDSLQWFAQSPRSPLEIIESIDMLRFLESGRKIKMLETPYATKSVDAPEDLARADELMRADALFQTMDYTRKVTR